MDREISKRLLNQRMRNRIMEVLEYLADGEEAVRLVGHTDYFEYFYDLVPHRDDAKQHPNAALSLNDALSIEEREVVLAVSSLLDDACDATPPTLTDEVLIASGWPQRIQPVAAAAFELMMRRGRFSDEVEENEPGLGSA